MKSAILLCLLLIFTVCCASQLVILPRQFDASLSAEKRKEIYAQNKMRVKPGFLGGPRFVVGEGGPELSHLQIPAYFLTSSVGAYSTYDMAVGQQSASTLFNIFGVFYLAVTPIYFFQGSAYGSSASSRSSGLASLVVGALCLATGIIFGALSFENFKQAVSAYNWDLMNALNLKMGEISFTGGMDSIGLRWAFRF